MERENIEVEKKDEKMVNDTHQILLQNRKNLTMTGISRVDSTNENGVSAMVGDTPIEIAGSGIHIRRLDVERGVIQLDGEINSIKYDQKVKGNFVKRLFK